MVVRSKLGAYTITENDHAVLIRVFKDPALAGEFIQLLERVQRQSYVKQQTSSENYLMTEEPAVKALALQYKGQVGFTTDLINLLKQVNK